MSTKNAKQNTKKERGTQAHPSLQPKFIPLFLADTAYAQSEALVEVFDDAVFAIIIYLYRLGRGGVVA